MGFHPKQRSAKCSQASPAHPVFVNKVLSEDSCAHLFTYHLGCFGSTVANGLQKAKNAHWPLIEKISQLLFHSLAGNRFWIHENSQVEKTLGWGVGLFFSSLCLLFLGENDQMRGTPSMS